MTTSHEADLDDLYWNTNLPIAAIAERCGIPASRLHLRVTPIDAGLACYRCRTAVTYTSRSTRDAARPRCPRCGCSRIDPARARLAAPGAPDGLRLVRQPVLGGVVVVHDDGRDIGRTIDACAEALADAGVTWTGELVRVTDVGLVAPAVVRALAALTPGVVAVPTLGALGTSQAERLQVLFTLTSRGWRVISADDVEVARPERPLRRLDVDDIDDEPGDDDELGFASQLLLATAGPRRRWGRW
jgi:hypothetical protein